MSPKLFPPVLDCLTHCSLETPKRLIGKQYRPRSDATAGLPLTSRLRKSQTSYPSNLEVPQENLGSPTLFRAAAVCPFFSRTQVPISVSHRIIMIYASLRCVLKMSLSLFKIRSHLFGKPVLVCRTLEKASTLVQLRIRFKAQRKKKEK